MITEGRLRSALTLSRWSLKLKTDESDQQVEGERLNFCPPGMSKKWL
jgi:hypothetical protein